MRRETHQKIMRVAADYLFIPTPIAIQLIHDVVLPDDLDKGINRTLKHILVHVYAGGIGGALTAIDEEIDMAKKGSVDPIRHIAFASHYLQDLCNPFHCSLYSIYDQGYHNIFEIDVNSHFDEWIKEYSPEPMKFGNIDDTVRNISKHSSELANKLLLGFVKFELLKETYPTILIKECCFRAVNCQLGFLEWVKSKNIF